MLVGARGRRWTTPLVRSSGENSNRLGRDDHELEAVFTELAEWERHLEPLEFESAENCPSLNGEPHP